MHYFKLDIFLGAAILIVDILAWRVVGARLERLRLATRVVLTLALTFILLRSEMSPFGPAPWLDNKVVHFLAQCLELLWWLQVAKLASALLRTEVIPKAWNLERLFRDVLRALIFVGAGVAAMAYVLEIPVRGLLATSGALAIVLGLAVQSTLSDVFSGVVLNATEPFMIGDWVFIGEIEGEIVESNWRATSLLNPHGNIVVIPNSVAAKANIINHSRPPRMHGLSVILEVAPEERANKVVAALEDAAAGAVDILSRPQPIVKAKRATANSIEYEVIGYVDDISKKTHARNTLFDLAQLHLAASGIFLRPLTVPKDARENPCSGERLLRCVEMFDTLTDAQISTLADALITYEYQPGEMITGIDKDDSTSGGEMRIVAKGVATLFLTQGGREIELRRMSPGDSFGQSEILAGKASGGMMRAVTATTICCLNKKALTPILHERPEIARRMCGLLALQFAREESLLGGVVTMPERTDGFSDWLRDGIQRLHDLVIWDR